MILCAYSRSFVDVDAYLVMIHIWCFNAFFLQVLSARFTVRKYNILMASMTVQEKDSTDNARCAKKQANAKGKKRKRSKFNEFCCCEINILYCKKS